MKIDRLIGIITILLQKEKVTAPCLAEKFEVSRRTINRDIEDICKADIPVITQQGAGGITIAEGYKIDETLFTDEELRAVLTGLLSLNSVAQDEKYQDIIDKFFSDKNGIYGANHILIDLSFHYKNSPVPKIADLQKAIEASVTVEFTYCSSTGGQNVIFDPYIVVFQWSGWYAIGYYQESGEFRTEQISRYKKALENYAE